MIPRCALLAVRGLAAAAAVAALAALGACDERSAPDAPDAPDAGAEPGSAGDEATGRPPARDSWDPYTHVPHPPGGPWNCLDHRCDCGHPLQPDDRDCPPGFTCQCCLEGVSCECVQGEDKPSFIQCCAAADPGCSGSPPDP
jgi:hypothetical protein